jgi:hypothetical protein
VSNKCRSRRNAIMKIEALAASAGVIASTSAETETLRLVTRPLLQQARPPADAAECAAKPPGFPVVASRGFSRPCLWGSTDLQQRQVEVVLIFYDKHLFRCATDAASH